MKLKNTIFVNGFVPALGSLLGEKLPGRTAYKIARFAKEVSEKNKVYEDARIALVKQYGEEDKEKNFKVLDKNLEVFTKELNDIQAIEEDYSLKEKIQLPKDIKISPRELIALEDVVSVED